MSVSVVLPSYNEAGNIAAMIDALTLAFASRTDGCEMVVVDDDSPDGTADVVRRHAANRSDVRLIVRVGERGLAAAIRRGFEESTRPNVALLATDFNQPPGALPGMLDVLAGCDVVVGSRFVPGGGMAETGRYYLSLLYNLWIRAALGTGVNDNTSGMIVMPRELLFSFDVDWIFHGYGDWSMRLYMAARRRGLTIREVPVRYGRRRHGTSKTDYGAVFVRYTRAVLAARRAPPP